MFFLIFIIFIVVITFLVILISALINLDINILLLADRVESDKNWLIKNQSKINSICSDSSVIIEKYKEKMRKHQLKFIIGQGISLLEWYLLFVLKPKYKKWILMYKLVKRVNNKLSMLKNML